MDAKEVFESLGEPLEGEPKAGDIVARMGFDDLAFEVFTWGEWNSVLPHFGVRLIHRPAPFQDVLGTVLGDADGNAWAMKVDDDLTSWKDVPNGQWMDYKAVVAEFNRIGGTVLFNPAAK